MGADPRTPRTRPRLAGRKETRASDWRIPAGRRSHAPGNTINPEKPVSTMTRIGADLPTRMRIVPFAPFRTGLATVRTGMETVGVSRAALDAESSRSVSAAVAGVEITSAPAAAAAQIQ